MRRGGGAVELATSVDVRFWQKTGMPSAARSRWLEGIRMPTWPGRWRPASTGSSETKPSGRLSIPGSTERQELKRRETQALLISMRASTIVAEIMMRELGEQVRALGDRIMEHRQAMQPLREENAALEAHLRSPREPPDGAGNSGQPASGTSRNLLGRLRDLVSRRGVYG